MTNNSKKMPITEEQAKLLLEQAQMKTERNLKGSTNRGKKWLVIGVILVVAAILMAVLSRTMMDGLSK